jgi:hypothetical protein
MCDISFTNGKGLLGQVINKIHEDKLINTPLELETFLIKRDNDIPKIDNNNTIENKLDTKILNDMQRWQYIYYTSHLEPSHQSDEINLLTKRSSVLEDALNILVNDYTKINNEFIQNIHLTDREKITNLQLTEIYDIPIVKLSEKWNIILKYQNIFKNLFNILDDNMKKTTQVNDM